MSKDLHLIIVQALPAKKMPNGEVLLTRKLMEATIKFGELWPGSITVLMEETEEESSQIDPQKFKLRELPFKLEIGSFDKLNPDKLRKKNSLVLATLGYRQNHISQICKEANIPCIYISEYTLKTRRQIVAVEESQPIKRFKRLWRNRWEEKQEQKQLNAIALADGLQCNGTPTYDEYKKLCSDTLLFFDTRITEDMMITPDELEKRTQRLIDNKPLRLVFSGRLNKMKGADHLLDVAQELKLLKIPFKLFISGSGDLKEPMKQRIAAEGLNNYVKMLGVPDFKTRFFPFVKERMDLFICCHRQGDPSCTYIETMSCGVPIVGYANEAFEGIVAKSKSGWLVEMNQPKLLAKKVAELNLQREEIKAMSNKAIDFARKYTFEKTYDARVAHMKQIAMRGKSTRQISI
ncbi:MAG: glycosyltransferase [Coleofasciculaceae cyanobacterium]